MARRPGVEVKPDSASLVPQFEAAAKQGGVATNITDCAILTTLLRVCNMNSGKGRPLRAWVAATVLASEDRRGTAVPTLQTGAN